MIHGRINLTFAIDKASPKVLPKNISWKFRRAVDGTTIDPINEQTDPRYEFSSDRKSLVIYNLTLEDEGQYTITAKNEVGSDSLTVILSVEG